MTACWPKVKIRLTEVCLNIPQVHLVKAYTPAEMGISKAQWLETRIQSPEKLRKQELKIV